MTSVNGFLQAWHPICCQSPKDNGLSFQATYTPLFNTTEGTMPFWIGVGIGYFWK